MVVNGIDLVLQVLTEQFECLLLSPMTYTYVVHDLQRFLEASVLGKVTTTYDVVPLGTTGFSSRHGRKGVLEAAVVFWIRGFHSTRCTALKKVEEKLWY